MLPPAVGAAPSGRPDPATELAERWILKLEEKFPDVVVENYVVMPNHVHLLLFLDRGGPGGHMGPPLPEIVGWYKTMTTNEYFRLVRQGVLPPLRDRLWQRSYYDHVLRNEDDYLRTCAYIENNPAKWAEDNYYIPSM